MSKENEKKDYFNFFDNTLVELQKNWLKLSSDFMKNCTQSMSQGLGGDMFSQCRSMWENLSGSFQAAPQDTAGDVYSKVVEAAKVYMNILKPMTSFEFMSGNLAGENYKSFLDSWVDIQKSIMKNLFGSILPPQFLESTDLPDIMERMLNSYKNSVSDLFSVFNTDAKPMVDDFLKVLDSGMGMFKEHSTPGDYKAFHESWHKAYDDMFGKYLKVPSIGPSREIIEKIKKDIDSFINYLGAMGEFYMSMYKPGMEVMEEISRKGTEVFDTGRPEDFKEFYEYLIATLEEKFMELFKSPVFGETIKSILSASLDFRAKHSDMIEEMLKDTPVTTRTEADEIHKEVYLLKKRVAQLEKQLRSATGSKQEKSSGKRK